MGDGMGSLNPEWLAIELNSIDATAKNWSNAVQASYKAAVDAAHAKGAQQGPPAPGSGEVRVEDKEA